MLHYHKILTVMCPDTSVFMSMFLYVVAVYYGVVFSIFAE